MSVTHDDAPETPSYPTPSLLARLGAEFVGTFFLVLVLIGGGLYLGIAANADALTIPVVGGAAFAIAIAVFGHLGGGHFNPAITLGYAMTSRLAWGLVLPYWVSQILGAIAGAGVVFALIPANLATAMGHSSASGLMSSIASGYGEQSPLGTGAARQQIAVEPALWQAFILEILTSALLVGLVLLAARKFTGHHALISGASYAVLLMVTYPLTGGSLNPARATGVAFFAQPWALGQLWLFWLAPILGAVIAGLVITISGPAAPEQEEVSPLDPEVQGEELGAQVQPATATQSTTAGQSATQAQRPTQTQPATPAPPADSSPRAAGSHVNSDGFEVRDYRG